MSDDDLYVIACAETRRCKIGRSNSVWSRFDRLQMSSPTRLVIFGIAPGLGVLEDVLHARFAAGRLHGEWFSAPVMEHISSRAKFKDQASFVRFVESVRDKWKRRADGRVRFAWRNDP
jgi:hypothetical protein